MRTALFALLLAAPVLCFTGPMEAAGLKVSPGRFIVRNIEPGREYDVYRESHTRLTVYNDGDTERTWALSLNRPSERGRWETGYTEMPDPRWCWFEEDEITVPPHGEAHAHLHLKIPDEERYYNQHWVATATVGGRAGGGPIALAVDVRILLETKAKPGLGERPDGRLGLEPSMVLFHDLQPGKKEKSRIVLHNGDDETHEYSIDSLFAHTDLSKASYLTASFEAPPDDTWITYERSVTVAPRGSHVLDLAVLIPEDEDNHDKKWEEILLIRPDAGSPAFIRIQMETIAEARE